MTRRKSQKRTYHSESRQAQSENTKTRILQAAKKLFESNGFETTTIEDLAKDAGVSSASIYALYKSKLGVLRHLIDEALPVDKREALVEKTKIEKSPTKSLELAAKIARQIYDAEKEQLLLMRGASVLDPTLRKLEREREVRRYERIEAASHG